MPLAKKFFRVNWKLKLRQMFSNHRTVYHLRSNQDHVGCWSAKKQFVYRVRVNQRI